MAQIIPGSVIGAYETTAVTLCMSKNQNNRGFTPAYIVLTVKDEGSAGSTPKTLMFFEGEQISTEEIKLFGKYKAQQPDAQGGYPVSIQALRASKEDWETLKKWFYWPGGNNEVYKLRKGLCYGNDLDEKRSKKKDGSDVITDSISVFTQVKFFTPNADGSLTPNYFPGLGLEEQGRRMEDRFFKVPVEQAPVNFAERAAEDAASGAASGEGGKPTPF